jgi:hypothetical protein
MDWLLFYFSVKFEIIGGKPQREEIIQMQTFEKKSRKLVMKT